MTRSQRLAALTGMMALLTYLAATTGAASGESRIMLTLLFAIGPVAFIGITRLVSTLEDSATRNALRIARGFLGAAFVLFTLMVVVQQTTVLQLRDMINAAPDATTASLLRTVARGSIRCSWEWMSRSTCSIAPDSWHLVWFSIDIRRSDESLALQAWS